jgi:alpha-tubulin suppressor-like RCC1 family protein
LRVPDSVVVLEGDSVTLVAALVDSTGDALPPVPLAWASDDTMVVRVSGGGVLRPVRPGATTVAVLGAGLSARVRVTSAVRYAQLGIGSFGGSFMRWCGLTERGSLYCLPGNTDRPKDRLIGLERPAGATLRSIAVGGEHVCALTTDDRASCWGSNRTGQLGADTAIGTYTIVWAPVAVGGGLRFRSLSAGAAHTCGVTASGAAYCWGAELSGRLGDDDSTSHSGVAVTPVAVLGGHSFSQVSAGTAHTCGLTTDGALYCWGNNAWGQLGIGAKTPLNAFRPLAVVGATPFSSVSAGDHTCAVGADGSTYCWGSNAYGALGHSTDSTCDYGYPCSLSPQRVSLPTVLQVGTGVRLANTSRTCALLSGGSVDCWGRGPVGDGVGDVVASSPVPVAGGHAFRAIAVGEADACGITVENVVYCWGSTFGLVPQRLPYQP